MKAAPRHGLWWAAPTGVLLLVMPVSVWLAVAPSDLTFRLLYRTPKVLTEDTALLFLAAAAVLLVGVTTSMTARPGSWSSTWPDLAPAQVRVIARAADVSFWLTLTGYAAFAVAGAARGATLSQLLEPLTSQANYSGELKEVFAPVTGLTTLTQVGVAYVVLAGLLLAAGHRTGVGRRVALLFFLALLRTFFLTERLAVLELAVPFLLLLAVAAHRRGDIRTTLAPLAALPALVLVFGAFEYSRSWTFFRTRTTSTYPEFVMDRLAGYYATAYNNGAITLEHGRYEGRVPYASLEGLWTAPGVEQLSVYERLSGRDAGAEYSALLEQFGTPEFNNPCGICTPLFDFGVIGGLLLLAAAGLVVGLAWTGFRSGHAYALVLYPLVFTGLLELPRYLYWTQGRVVPAVLVLLVAAHAAQRHRPAAARSMATVGG